jgi:hypothetical protein
MTFLDTDFVVDLLREQRRQLIQNQVTYIEIYRCRIKELRFNLAVSDIASVHCPT